MGKGTCHKPENRGQSLGPMWRKEEGTVRRLNRGMEGPRGVESGAGSSIGVLQMLLLTPCLLPQPENCSGHNVKAWKTLHNQDDTLDSTTTMGLRRVETHDIAILAKLSPANNQPESGQPHPGPTHHNCYLKLLDYPAAMTVCLGIDTYWHIYCLPPTSS